MRTKVLTPEEVEFKYGLTSEQIDQWEREAADGILPGRPSGEVMRGRPLMFGEKTRQVGFKESLIKIEAIDRRAAQLGMRRSDYLRRLVDEDLKLAGLA